MVVIVALSVLGIVILTIAQFSQVFLRATRLVSERTQAAFLAQEGSEAIRLGFSILAAALLVFTHRSNIARLRAGAESRFERVRVLGRWLSKKSA